MQRKKKLFLLQVAFLALFAVSVLIMPIMARLWIVSDGVPVVFNNTPMIINGGLFWGSLIGLICCSVIFNRERRKSSFTVNKEEGYDRLGLLHFRQNKAAFIADVVMFISLAVFIILCLLGNQVPVLTFVMLAVFVFSFGAHCLYNGAGYIYVYQYDEKHKTKDKKR